MIGRRAGLALWLALAPAGGAADDEPPPPPEPPGVTVAHDAGITRLEARFPGKVMAYAIPAAAGGGRELLVLVAATRQETTADDTEVEKQAPRCPPKPGETPPPARLFRVDRAALDLVELRADLPGDATALDALDLDGDGTDEWILTRPDTILRIDGGRLLPLVEAERVAVPPRLHGTPLATSVHEGRLGVFGPAAAAAGERWTMLAEVALPATGWVRGSEIAVRYSVPDLVGRRADGAWLFATRPETVGRQRLRLESIVVPPSGEAAIDECWARLPAPEDVLERHYLMLDGRPVLLVATKPADKLALFGEKRLRLYDLERDRSHRGIDPLFAVESRLNLWQEAVPLLYDADADGREDLVIGYWKGLAGDRVVLDVYPRVSDGSFAKSARTTAFDVKDADRSYVGFGHDLDGDGLADLVLYGDGRWWMYAGRESGKGGNLVEGKPRELLRQEARAGPRFVDLDGDGRSELLWAGPAGSTLRWLRVD